MSTCLQVREIMRNVDTDKDGRVSRKEYLTKIRKDRKYADFLKMPPRIRQGDGTLEKFIETFQDINCLQNGRFSVNELAFYLGCAPSTGSLFDEGSRHSIASHLGAQPGAGPADEKQLPPSPEASLPTHTSRVQFLQSQGSTAGQV